MRRLTRYSGRSTVTWPLPIRTPESTHCSWLPSSSVNENTITTAPAIIAAAVNTVRRRWRRRLRRASTRRTRACIAGSYSPESVSAGGTRAARTAG